MIRLEDRVRKLMRETPTGSRGFSLVFRRAFPPPRKPSEGIWYHVYLRPRWQFLPFPLPDPDVETHPDFWEKVVSRIVARHYGVDRKEVWLCAYGMPRGRVAVAAGKYLILHGNEHPGVSKERMKKDVISAFFLVNELLRGNVAWKYDEHERMVPEDVEELTAIVGEKYHTGGRKRTSCFESNG